jgi:threonine dehydrogenase-like Zn-dependent dehydrogenase
MKALVLKTVETLEVMDVPMPVLQPGLVLVKVSKCGVCGSDVRYFHGENGTEMTPPERQAIILPAVPAHKIGTVEEIARLVVFPCSDKCSYMTGASIAVDGGLTLGYCASRPGL